MTGLSFTPPPNTVALTTANNTAGAVQAAVPAPATGNKNQPSIIIVEFVGFGGDDSDQQQEQQRRNDEQRRSSPGEQGYNYDPDSAFHVIGNGQLTEEQKNRLTSREKRNLDQLVNQSPPSDF